MSYKDVREWIQKVDEMGELKIVENADWNLEIGALSVLSSKHKENTPALLFGRYVVVVDDDIDVYDINDILWAMCSRSARGPGRCDRDHPPVLERPAGPDHSERQEGFQLAHDHRCMPAFRMDGKLPARRRNRRGVPEEFNGEVAEGTV